MPFIILIAAASVAVVFLIVFNLSVARKHRTRGSRPMPSADDIETAVQRQAALPDGNSEHPSRPDNALSAGNPQRLVGHSANVDHSYRQAVRNFIEEPATPESEAATPPQSRDDEYRKAVRSIHKRDK